MIQSMWKRLLWWLRGPHDLQVHEAPELIDSIDDDELTEEVLAEIFGGVLNRVCGEINV